MKIFDAFLQSLKKNDNTPMERLEYSNVRSTIEDYCDEYLEDAEDILTVEVLPSSLDAALAVLESEEFLEKYEFNQISATLFMVKMKELDLV